MFVPTYATSSRKSEVLVAGRVGYLKVSDPCGKLPAFGLWGGKLARRKLSGLKRGEARERGLIRYYFAQSKLRKSEGCSVL
jgi:hypothetical protein